jgi:hypothetical protein
MVKKIKENLKKKKRKRKERKKAQKRINGSGYNNYKE